MSSGVTAIADLRRLLGPARDQGARPTCLAFAVSDAHAAIRQPGCKLSVEYLYFHAQAHAGRSANAGCTPLAVIAALQSVGQPVESDWPYLAEVPEPVTDWRPPDLARRYRRAADFRDASLPAIVGSLGTDRPPVLVIGVTAPFYTPDVGGIVHQADGGASASVVNHAVVAVGYGTFQDEQAVLVRNSWGRGWGLDGHAWLTGGYLRSCLLGVLSLKEEVDVSRNSAAA